MLKIANTVQFKYNISDMRMHACKNTCVLYVLLCVCFIDSGNLWHKRVVRIGVT